MSLKQWREQRESVAKSLHQMRDKITAAGYDPTAEDKANWERVNRDFDSIQTKIDASERGDHVDAILEGRGNSRPGMEDYIPGGKRRGIDTQSERFQANQALAMSAWFRRQLGKPLTDDQKRACRAVGFSPSRKTLDIRLPRNPGAQLRSNQSVGTNSEGGYLVPQGFVNKLETALKYYCPVREYAEVLRTDGGNPLPWPTVNDTTNSGTLVSENTAVTEVPLVFGSHTFGAYKFTSGLVLMSSELDQDSAISMTENVGALLGERIGRGQCGYFTTGTGSAQPAGIVTGSSLGKTAASATAIAADELIDLQHSVDVAYRNGPGVGWMMNDGIAASVRKLKDGASRYLWDMDALLKGQPPLLLGKPVVINQAMQATIATNTKTVLFGDLSKMKIRDAGVVRVRRLVERYADADQIAFLAFMRSDSAVLDAGTHPIKHLLQA